MARVAGFFLHYYQPPRENPWLGLVPNEWSAWPYHDWNERITAECYRAMVAVSLPRNEDGGVELFEPLAQSTYDIGPTLHHWLQRSAADVDRAIGYQARHVASSPTAVAFAAPLSHAIMPLARQDDKDRLVAWGIADYVQRFGVTPTGMWLPETAVDMASLDTLARHGIAFTVLMPGQALRVRPLGTDEWREVDAQSIDTTKSYLVRLHDGRSITVVFGQRDLSQRVAFEGLIDNGTDLANAMMDQFGDDPDGAVVLVADGETYGHHHRFGDLGLAWALRHVQRHFGVATTLGEWMTTHEATFEVELRSVSAWSCAHGVERWRSDCGCTTGSSDGWHQQWRRPLREALDWLRDELGDAADAELAHHVESVNDALVDYGRVIAGTIDPMSFVREHVHGDVDDDVATTVLTMCEIHLNLQYSFTSCAWFFADPAAIETAIVLRYAALAMEYAKRSLDIDLCEQFVNHLDGLRSNVPGIDADLIWRRATEDYRFDDRRVVGGFAAEHFADADSARTTRGHWSLRVVETPDDPSASSLRVELTHRATLRRSQFTARVERTGDVGLKVLVIGENGEESTLTLGQLGADVVARVIASWLVEPGSVDFEVALDELVANILMRTTNDDDAAAVVSLATSMRSVSPSCEATIRRALLAITARVDREMDHRVLVPLARCVGLDELISDSGPVMVGD